MKRSIFLAIVVLLPALSLAATLAPNPSHTRTASLGTKGFSCYSTINKVGVKCKTATAAGVATVSKWFFNGNEAVTYPTAEEEYAIVRGSVTSICQRAYSSATPVNKHCVGQ
jgi:hypothetical protein